MYANFFEVLSVMVDFVDAISITLIAGCVGVGCMRLLWTTAAVAVAAAGFDVAAAAVFV